MAENINILIDSPDPIATLVAGIERVWPLGFTATADEPDWYESREGQPWADVRPSPFDEDDLGIPFSRYRYVLTLRKWTDRPPEPASAVFERLKSLALPMCMVESVERKLVEFSPA